MNKLIIFVIFFIFSALSQAKQEYLSCTNMKESFSDEQLTEMKLYLKSDYKREYFPSKIIIAASIGDITYIKNQKSFDALFEAFYLTLSSDMLIFDDLLELLKEKDINRRSHEGVTLLMMASDCGKVKAVESFLAKGANINQKHEESGADPLNIAVINQDEKMVSYLISKGSNCRESKYTSGVTVEELSKKLANSQISKLIGSCTHKRPL